jgi:homoserine O-acetyltransferase
VRLQHRLVTEELGIDRLRLITGWSMGAAQCYQWGAQYPEAMGALAPIAGSARTAVYNRVFLYALRRTLTLDPDFKDGRYEAPPLAGLKAFATIYAGWGLSEPFYRTRAYEALGAADLEDFVRQFWEPHFTHCDANDLLSQIWTWEHADISDDPRYGGDLDAALAAIQARTIVVPVDQDRYFPPVDAQSEAARMPNAECRVLRSDWGHYAPRNPADWPAIDAVLHELLEG